jgi:hypothetical protein
MRTMFCSAVIELRQRQSGKISDLIFPEVIRLDSIRAYSLLVLGIEKLLEVTDCVILLKATIFCSMGPRMEMMRHH